VVSKCANPDCSTPFLYFHTGKLFRLETEAGVERRRLLGGERDAKKPMRRIEFYWLCDRCASKMVLSYERGAGISVRHRFATEAAPAPSAASAVA
jgi:hypothetical protein